MAFHPASFYCGSSITRFSFDTHFGTNAITKNRIEVLLKKIILKKAIEKMGQDGIARPNNIVELLVHVPFSSNYLVSLRK